MISDSDPMKAMLYISELQPFWAVFSLPPGMEPLTPKGCERLCVAYMDSAWRLLQLIGSSSITDDQHRLYLYSALLLPLRNAVYKDKKGKKVLSMHLDNKGRRIRELMATMMILMITMTAMHMMTTTMVVVVMLVKMRRISDILSLLNFRL